MGVGKLLVFALFTRILILTAPWVTSTLLTPEADPQSFVEFTQTAWNRWDAPHYLYLAQNWYTNVGDERNFIVFFPLYPLLLKPLIALNLNPVFLGILISTTLFIAGIYLFYKLVSLEYSEKIAERAVIALSIFPTTYFFNSPYTESLFLFVFSAAMLAAARNKWGLAGVFGGLGVITRPFGILILPALFTEWFFKKNGRKWYQLIFITLPSVISAGFYLLINNSVFGTPFAFKQILLGNWQKHPVLPNEGIMSSWKIALSSGEPNFVIMVGWAEAFAISLMWILIPFTFKFLKKSWAVYYMLSVVLFSSTSFVLSTPRYVLSVPVVFVLIALAEKNQLFRMVFRFSSIAVLFCLAILFARGQWAF